jgi:hypothetical protein
MLMLFELTMMLPMLIKMLVASLRLWWLLVHLLMQ